VEKARKKAEKLAKRSLNLEQAEVKKDALGNDHTNPNPYLNPNPNLNLNWQEMTSSRLLRMPPRLNFLGLIERSL